MVARFIEFMQTNCGLTNLELTGKSVEVVGLLAYDFMMELVIGSLNKKQEMAKQKVPPLEPIHIVSFLEKHKKPQ